MKTWETWKKTILKVIEMKGPILMDGKEYKDHILHFFGKAVDFEVLEYHGWLIIFLSKKDLVINQDRSITWYAEAATIGLHGFLTLRTGERREKEAVIPFCAATKRGREVLDLLMESMKESKARIYVGTKRGEESMVSPHPDHLIINPHPFVSIERVKGAEISFDAAPLAVIAIMSRLIPPQAISQFVEEADCPYCQEEAFTGSDGVW